MKYKLLPIFLSLPFVLSSHSAYGQDMSNPTPRNLIPKKARTQSDYQPRTLKEIATLGSTVTRSCEENSFLITSDILPSRVRVTYTGEMRPLRNRKQQVIFKWAQRYAGAPETYIQPYKTEMQFVENGITYWLPVRTRDIPQLELQLRQGDLVDLNLIRLGGVQSGSQWEWVLLVEGFTKS